MHTKLYNTLVFPAGTEVGLEVYRALKYIRHFKIIGANSSSDHSDFVYSNGCYALPFIDDDAFLDEFCKLVHKEKVHFIIPAHDEVAYYLSKCKESGKLPNGVKLVTSPATTCEICRFKSKTYKVLRDKIDTPKVYEKSSLSIDLLPLFVKPDNGQGSRGAFILDKPEQLRSLNDSSIVCELLNGEEYTVDCFTDKNRELRHCSARIRSRVKGGISVRSEEYYDPLIQEIAKKINKTLSFEGVWFFQLKRRTPSGELVLLEVAPRVAGAMGFTRAKGINLIALSLYNALGCEVEIFGNSGKIVRDCALYPRYNYDGDFNRVYVDLDDTLIFGDETNGKLLGLLIEFKNKGKELILITRHHYTYGNKVTETLKKHHICESLFSSIIEPKDDELKSSHMHESSILIDDSTKERLDAHNTLGVDTFTPNQFYEIFS